MTKKQTSNLEEAFAKSFKEVVLPTLEDMHEDVGVIKKDVDRIEQTLSRIEDRQLTGPISA